MFTHRQTAAHGNSPNSVRPNNTLERTRLSRLHLQLILVLSHLGACWALRFNRHAAELLAVMPPLKGLIAASIRQAPLLGRPP